MRSRRCSPGAASRFWWSTRCHPTPSPRVAEGVDPELASLAWRMRRVERSVVLDRLAALGCPVVAWRGPGTLDDVLHRLARRAQLPQVRAR